jgi:hypothetical protein
LLAPEPGTSQAEHDRILGDEYLSRIAAQRIQTLTVFQAVAGRAIGVALAHERATIRGCVGPMTRNDVAHPDQASIASECQRALVSGALVARSLAQLTLPRSLTFCGKMPALAVYELALTGLFTAGEIRHEPEREQ